MTEHNGLSAVVKTMAPNPFGKKQKPCPMNVSQPRGATWRCEINRLLLQKWYQPKILLEKMKINTEHLKWS